jgi:AraC-like DNA-binding protein
MQTLAESLDNTVQSRWGDAFLHVLAIALSGIKPIDGAIVTDVVLLHKERIKTFARRHLSDPRLNCEMIAKHLRLSQRYIYDMFAQEPLTLMRWIRRERLERCKTELSLPRLQRRTISEIAFTWGFVDPAHFSRVFSAEFGVSPRVFRSKSISACAH